MKTKTSARPIMSRLFTGALFCAAALMPLASLAQQNPPPPPPPVVANNQSVTPPGDDIVNMNPFVVNTSKDTGYGALQSNSLTAFRMDLEKMPATAQVFTRTFMDDVGASNIMDMLATYSGVITADPNNTGAAFIMPGDRDGSGGNLGIRGLQATMPKRDGFLGLNTSSRTSLGNLDNYSLDRVEVIEGPQSILYGAVGGGGVINTVSKQANFDVNKGSVGFSFDKYGSKRAQFDINAGAQNFAVRVAGIRSSARTQRYNLGNDGKAIYAQIAIRITNWLNFRILHDGSDTDNIVASIPNLATTTWMPAGDPRLGKNMTYLALTGQLNDLQGKLWNMPVNYQTIGSAAGWWNSERIKVSYNSAVFEAKLPFGLSAQLAGVYSETTDQRITGSVGGIYPAKGMTGAGNNPYDGTAIGINPAENFQSDRSRGIRFTLLHDITLLKGNIHSMTAAGVEYTRQFPAFGSSGIDMLYYKADANWNVTYDPKITLDYGRTPLPTGSLFVPIQNGFNTQPFFRPGTERITINGQNYVLQQRIKMDSSITPPTATNPWSLVPNNGKNYSGNYNKGADTHRRFAFLSNFTDWWDGRLTTIIGGSLNRYESQNVGASNTNVIVPSTDLWSWQIGANYRIDWHRLKGLRVYANISTSGMAAGTTRDFYGTPLKVPKATSPQPELGLKYTTPDNKLIFQFSWNLNTEVKNETRNAGTDYFNAVNPNGINGRWNNGDQWINLDRTASSQGLTVTYAPTRNWRMRLSLTHLDGKIKSDVNYKQLYNDQFHVNSSGVVTYGDGTPVMVDPNAKGGAATDQLTLAMINTANGPWWANPDPNSGSITNANLKTALTTDTGHGGPAATGVNGLPITAMQYNFTNPHADGVITVVQSGEKNTGFNEWNLNYTTNYTIPGGILKGLGIFGSLTTYQRNRAFYTTTPPASGASNAFTQKRSLVSLPVSTGITLGINYTFKINERMSLTSRLNISNVLDSSDVWVLPSVANSTILNARLSAQPRNFLWTNTLNF